MPPKKVNLKSSVSSINAKAAVASKKKPLPKLKAILANPYKPKLDVLDASELTKFQDLITTEVESSGISGREFAKQNKIQLGLGSSLRWIGNKRASCVMMAQSIKPKFIADQIGYFTRQKDSTTPIYVVPDWENISAKLFGVKALVVVFPLDVSGKLGKWISHRKLPIKENKNLVEDSEYKEPILPKVAVETKINFEDFYLKKSENGERAFVPDVVVKPEPVLLFEKKETKDWTGDFISFSDDKNEEEDEPMDMDEIDDEFRRKQNKALKAMQSIANKNKVPDIKHKVKEDKKEKGLLSVNKKKVSESMAEEWESDKYISLEVHKLQPNPNRKPKKKKKNKNKKVN